MQSFSDSYLNNFSTLKHAKIGFELEFYSKLNYPLTLEVFNRKLPNIKVWGFKQYHSDFKPDNENFKLEPDLSGGFNMAELVTGPMEYTEARLVLVQLLKILQEIAYTTERSGIHVNISFDPKSGQKIESLNPLKLILGMDEDKIYEVFPDRVNNVYAKSIKNIIPFTGYDYSSSTANVLNNALLLPYTKYYGVNFSVLSEGRLEFRYLGGENYEKKIDDILDLMDYFINTSWNCLGKTLNSSEAQTLRRYLDKNIGRYKSMSKLDNFLAHYPTVSIEVDKQSSYDIVNAYFPSIYESLFTLINGVKNLEDFIVNFDTETKKIEIVDAEIRATTLLKQYDFINCHVSGDVQSCEFIGCELDKAIINQCRLSNTNVNDSKVLESSVDELCELKDCYFSEGYLNGTMEGGVFRSGKLGEMANLSEETKILNKEQNFFNLNIQQGEITKGGSKKPMFDKKK